MFITFQIENFIQYSFFETILFKKHPKKLEQQIYIQGQKKSEQINHNLG
ncbi:hypothetical protein pb186bvf_003696 [Paramecium bursaria]